MNRRIILAGLIFIAMDQACDAQTWNEWFAQKKTRREYLLQQIAALQVYTGYLQKGYDIVKNGINTINDIMRGDFDLHSIFFESSNEVNPAVSSYSEVAAILDFASCIERSCNNAINLFGKDENFTTDEKDYLKNVFTTILDKTAALAEELNRIISDDYVDMKDEERLEKIETLYKDVKDKYAFVQSFQKTAQVLSAQRMHGQTEIVISKKLNAIP